jgi:hypothetical protein
MRWQRGEGFQFLGYRFEAGRRFVRKKGSGSSPAKTASGQPGAAVIALLHQGNLFAIRKVFRADTDLDDPSLVDTSDAHVLKHAVIDFALARRLDKYFLAAADQRPKCRRLGLLCRIRAESEIDPGVGQVSAT